MNKVIKEVDNLNNNLLTMSESIISSKEANRLDALKRYKVLDTPSENSFDRVARLASKIFNVPIALIAFVDKDRVWYKSNIGMPGIKEVDREVSLCSFSILHNGITFFEDILEFPMFSENPLVSGDPGIRFYAAAPLQSREGYSLGTICIIDKKPRSFSEEDKEMLKELAAIIMDEIELRVDADKVIQLQTDMLHRVVHDLKNPVTGIIGISQMLPNKLDDKALATEMLGMVNESCTKVMKSLNSLIQFSKKGEISLDFHQEPLNIGDLLELVIEDNKILAQQKDQKIHFMKEFDKVVKVDKLKMKSIFNNLINNAIKFSCTGKQILVYLGTVGSMLRFEVKDEGQGLTENDIKKVFQGFFKLSARPTAGESSTGLGLAVAKLNTELHGGMIWAESKGRDLGATFVVELPLEKIK